MRPTILLPEPMIKALPLSRLILNIITDQLSCLIDFIRNG